MTPYFTIFVCILWGYNTVYSCDFCNNLNGINPYYSGKNRLSLTYLYQHSVTDAVTATQPSLNRLGKISHSTPGWEGKTTEYRSTVDLTFFYHLSGPWAVSLSVPWQANRVSASTTTTTSWTGDVTLMAFYRLDGGNFNSWYRFILAGAGIQAPTGNDRLEDGNGNRLPADQQIGSGSWDIPVNVVWVQTWDKWTLSADGFGKLNGTNGFGERIGNSLSSTLSAAHDLFRDNPSGTAVIGLAGFRFESAGKDIKNGIRLGGTGYSNLFFQSSVKLVRDSFRWSLTAQIPVATNRPDSSPSEKTRLSAGLSWEWGGEAY